MSAPFWCEPSRWVGVEPNAFFAEAQAAAAANSSSPRETKWLKGETVDVEAGSFDAAVLTHVLCSVDDPAEVVRQAARALKSGGQLLVMEHVAAPEGTPMRAVTMVPNPIRATPTTTPAVSTKMPAVTRAKRTLVR